MATRRYFDSAEALEQVVAMGVVEGTTQAMSAARPRARRTCALTPQGKGTQTELLDDTHVRITPPDRGPARARCGARTHEPELMKQWLLGPDGWAMTVCEVDTERRRAVPLRVGAGRRAPRASRSASTARRC